MLLGLGVFGLEGLKSKSRDNFLCSGMIILCRFFNFMFALLALLVPVCERVRIPHALSVHDDIFAPESLKF